MILVNRSQRTDLWAAGILKSSTSPSIIMRKQMVFDCSIYFAAPVMFVNERQLLLL